MYVVELYIMADVYSVCVMRANVMMYVRCNERKWMSCCGIVGHGRCHDETSSSTCMYVDVTRMYEYDATTVC